MRTRLRIVREGPVEAHIVRALALDFDVLPPDSKDHADVVLLVAGPRTVASKLSPLRCAVDAPIVVVTAGCTPADRVEALERGADDVVPEPYDVPELLARVRAVARRVAGPQPDRLHVFGDLELNLMQRWARRSGRLLALSPHQFALLASLAKRGGDVVTRETLVDEVWGGSMPRSDSVLHTAVSGLRDRTEKPFARRLVTTVRGVGYALSAGG
jgi:DNA-binding response OmpR family regulator